MPYKDKEKHRSYHREYYHKNKDKIKADRNKPERKKKHKEYVREYCKKNKHLISVKQSECYQAKADVYKKRVQDRFSEHGKLVSEIKRRYGCMNKGCQWVGDYDPAMLDFHHIDPNQKVGTVNRMLGCSKEKLATEINKCVVICANCHRLHHSGRDIIAEHECVVNETLTVCEDNFARFVR